MATLNVHDKYAAEFKEFIKVKINKLKTELAELEGLLIGSEPVITNAPDFVYKEPVNLNGYKPLWTWKQKVTYLLNLSDRSTSEIVEAILEREPELTKDRSRVVGSVSAILSAKSKKPTDVFAKYQDERGTNIYKLNKPENG